MKVLFISKSLYCPYRTIDLQIHVYWNYRVNLYHETRTGLLMNNYKMHFVCWMAWNQDWCTYVCFSMLTLTQYQCCSRKHLWVVVDLKRQNIWNEWMNGILWQKYSAWIIVRLFNDGVTIVHLLNSGFNSSSRISPKVWNLCL